jgi:hypothetical protein
VVLIDNQSSTQGWPGGMEERSMWSTAARRCPIAAQEESKHGDRAGISISRDRLGITSPA